MFRFPRYLGWGVTYGPIYGYEAMIASALYVCLARAGAWCL